MCHAENGLFVIVSIDGRCLVIRDMPSRDKEFLSSAPVNGRGSIGQRAW
jgi:hypothetical protein